LYETFCKVSNKEELVDVLLGHPEFQRRGRRICYKFDREHGDDLFQEFSVKVWKKISAYNPENTPNEKALFALLYVIARNLVNSKRRKKRVLLEAIPENAAIRDTSTDVDYDCLRQEFLEFCKKTLPKYRRLVVVARFTRGYSYRELQQILESFDIICTHVTIRGWIKKAANDFSRGKSTGSGKR
jgi:RNA polymerase sigma factor (sigma-70 family)